MHALLNAVLAGADNQCMTLAMRASPTDSGAGIADTQSAVAVLGIDPSFRPAWVSPEMRLYIPLPNSHPRSLPVGEAVAWGTLKSGERIPLVASGDSGLATAYVWSAWRDFILTEQYATWRRRPLYTRSPISYRVVPDRLRHALAARMCRGRDKEPAAFPFPPFDGGFVALRDILRRGATSAPTRPAPRICLTHDIDTPAGFEHVREIAEVERSLGLRSSWNVVPFGQCVDFKTCDWLMGAGYEIGLHGHCHDNRLIYLSESEMRRRFDACGEFIARYDVRGFRSPSWLRNMRLMRVLAGYVDYDCSCLDFDWLCPAGRGGVLTPDPFRFGRLVELPTTIPFEAPAMLTGGAPETVAYWRGKVEWLKGVGGQALVSTHPDPHYLGNPPMIRAYATFLEELLSVFDGQWSLPRVLADEVSGDE